MSYLWTQHSGGGFCLAPWDELVLRGGKGVLLMDTTQWGVVWLPGMNQY